MGQKQNKWNSPPNAFFLRERARRHGGRCSGGGRLGAKAFAFASAPSGAKRVYNRSRRNRRFCLRCAELAELPTCATRAGAPRTRAAVCRGSTGSSPPPRRCLLKRALLLRSAARSPLRRQRCGRDSIRARALSGGSSSRGHFLRARRLRRCSDHHIDFVAAALSARIAETAVACSRIIVYRKTVIEFICICVVPILSILRHPHCL